MRLALTTTNAIYGILSEPRRKRRSMEVETYNRIYGINLEDYGVLRGKTRPVSRRGAD
jgi:hypothetical protein